MTEGESLSDSPRRTTSVNWPIAVDERLDKLLALARASGERTSRAQILATLVMGAPLDGEGLGVMVREYRRAGIADFEAQTGAVDGRTSQPGPRPHSRVPTSHD